MTNKIIPDEILKMVPLRYQFLDQITFQNNKTPTAPRVIKNNYYNSNHMLCINNYRKTSKLLDDGR